jgi:hypothetical protein
LDWLIKWSCYVFRVKSFRRITGDSVVIRSEVKGTIRRYYISYFHYFFTLLLKTVHLTSF